MAVLPPLTVTLPITLAPRQHAAPEAQSREPTVSQRLRPHLATRVQRLCGQVACIVP